MNLIIRSSRETLTGWRYFWAKRVTGFAAHTHCARCLVGKYLPEFGKAMPVNQAVELDRFGISDLIYFCGVAAPYRWANNMHLAVRITGNADDVAEVEMFTGDVLSVTGAKPIPFSGEVAAEQHPHRGREYLTCRNFQFGAQMAAEGVL